MLDALNAQRAGRASVLALIASRPAIPVVLYATLDAPSVRATVDAAHWGVKHVILSGFDDQPANVRAVLASAAVDHVAQAVLEAISRSLGDLPVSLLSAVEHMFGSPERFRTVDDLCREAMMPRRSLSRYVRRAGLRSARSLLVSARIVRAYGLVRRGSASLSGAASRLGIESSRILTTNARTVSGRAPSAWKSMAPAEFVRAVAAYLLT